MRTSAGVIVFSWFLAVAPLTYSSFSWPSSTTACGSGTTASWTRYGLQYQLLFRFGSIPLASFGGLILVTKIEFVRLQSCVEDLKLTLGTSEYIPLQDSYDLVDSVLGIWCRICIISFLPFKKRMVPAISCLGISFWLMVCNFFYWILLTLENKYCCCWTTWFFIKYKSHSIHCLWIGQGN